jgi:carbon starvation protein
MAILVIIVSIGSLKKCMELSKTVPPDYKTQAEYEAEELQHLKEQEAAGGDYAATVKEFEADTLVTK